MRKLFTVLFCGTALLATSCASIVSKTRYPVSITSVPNGATYTVVDRNGKEVVTGQAPGNVTLKSGAGFFKKAIYTVKFTKPGYDEKTLTIEADVNGWYIGNIVFGGIIGFLIVDPATGAMYKINQTDVQAMLNESVAFAPKQEKGLQIISIQDVPQELKDKMVEIK